MNGWPTYTTILAMVRSQRNFWTFLVSKKARCEESLQKSLLTKWKSGGRLRVALAAAFSSSYANFSRIHTTWMAYCVHIRTAKKTQLTSNFCFLDCYDVRMTLRHRLHPTGPRCLDLWSPSRLRRRSTTGIHVEAPDSIDVPANDTHGSTRFSKFRTRCHCILRVFPA